jgi:hypothetical protein
VCGFLNGGSGVGVVVGGERGKGVIGCETVPIDALILAVDIGYC